MNNTLKLRKNCMTKLRNDWERLDKAVKLINEIDPYLYLANGQAEHLEEILNNIGWHIKRDLGTIERGLLNSMKNKEDV